MQSLAVLSSLFHQSVSWHSMWCTTTPNELRNEEVGLQTTNTYQTLVSPRDYIDLSYQEIRENTNIVSLYLI